MPDSQLAFFRVCPICQVKFQYGPHIYEGSSSPLFDEAVCHRCYDAVKNEWSPRAESTLRDMKLLD